MERKRNSKGLYVHIPFCKRKCDYCDFYSLSGSESMLLSYVDAVLKEAVVYESYSIDTLYIGGGTPSLLGAKIGKLVKGLEKHFDFGLVETTVEANPESATTIFLDSAIKAGIDRISIGVQSLNNDELKSVGRIHGRNEAITSVKNAKKTGFRKISTDAIIGLPGQDWNSLKSTLSTLIDLGIGQISAYCLSVEEGTPLHKNIPDNLPNNDKQADLYLKTKYFLEDNGFKHVEISSFSLPGHEPVHNLNCWRGFDYIGLGAGASSFVDGIRYRNKKGLLEYVLSSSSRRIIDEGLNETERAVDEAMLRLRMLEEGIDIGEMSTRYDNDIISIIQERLNDLEDDDLIDNNNKQYTIPADKILISNRIFERMLFDE